MNAISIIAAIAVASSSQAQLDTTARIRGVASSTFNGRPLAGVMVSLAAGSKSVLSDSKGLFSLDGLPVGRQKIRISYDGQETQDYEFDLHSGDTKQLAIMLDLEAEDLSPVVAEEQSANTWRDLAGFYARRREYRGFARFYTREEIDHLRPRRLSSLLTLDGISTRCVTGCLPTRVSRTGRCAIPISVDGIPLHEDNYDEIAVSEVAAVEVYRGVPPNGLSPAVGIAVGSPIWVAGGRSSEATGACGLVAIWTR
jgi:hypothetical protein